MEVSDVIKYAKRLDKPYSEVLHLYYVENLSQKEIADKMNISLYKVRNCISKGLYLLRKDKGDEAYMKAHQILYGK